jgi:excinuclease UvrABC nuclease subunit
LEELMYKAVEELDFNKAAEYRDAIFKLKETKK